jgi:Cu/Ag efflux pump CusA
MYSLTKLPIDAVPDITNNQVAINVEVPSLSPLRSRNRSPIRLKRQWPVYQAWSYTRSISRNGFAQVTVIFEDNVDLYFARSQVNERLAQAKEDLPEGAEPRMGAISTGLGEIYMWTVEYENPEAEFTTPEGRVLKSILKRPCISGPCRTGLSGRSLKPSKALRKLMPLADMPSNTMCSLIRRNWRLLALTFSDVIEA